MLAAPPLRTVRASFPAHGSSHDETPGGAGGEPPSRSGWQCSRHAVLPDAAGRRHHEVFFPAFPPCGGRRQTDASTHDPAEVGTAFAAGPFCIPVIHAITARPSLSSAILYPLSPQFALRLPCPRGGAMTGLPSSDMSNRTGLGAVSPPVVLMAAPTQVEGAGPTTYLLVQASKLLPLAMHHDVYQPFT